MRGRRVRVDGEIDENFWAQAANQAAGQSGDDVDESAFPLFCSGLIENDVNDHCSCRRRSNSL